MLNIVESFKLGKRLLISPMVVLAMLVLFGIITFGGVAQLFKGIDEIYNVRFKNYQTVAELHREVAAIHANIYKSTNWATANYDAAKIEAFGAEQLKKLDQLAKTLNARAAAISTPESKPLYESAAKSLAEYKKFAATVIDFLSIDTNASTMTLATADDKFVLLDKDLNALNKLEITEGEKTYNSAKSFSRTLTIVFFATLFGALAVSLVVSFFMTNSIIYPIKQTIEIMGAISRGDLTRRLERKGNSEGILTQLAISVDTMTLSFSSIVSKVSSSAFNVASAAEQLNATAEKTASGSDKVALQTGTVAAATEEMAATSQEIARNCMLAADASNKSNMAAEAGAAVLQETISVMNEIADRVKHASESIESLGTKSNQIGEIINTIQDIADQTNLLALNAAIEAARAGEQGRGFAVVADEVRALAERTTRATRQITDMIKSIQSETHGAVVMMEEGVREVSSGTLKAAKSGDALQEILRQILKTSAEINQIATAAEQQTSTTNSISENMLEIKEIITDTARGAQESANASSQLARLSDDLQTLVKQFRIA